MPTPIDVGGDVTKILVGSVALRIAASGTSLPNIDGSSPIVWPAGWNKVGYTDAGVDLSYTPSYKDIKVDEELAPVAQILDAETCELSASLAEATLDNLATAISASTLTKENATSELGATSTLQWGSGTQNEVMVGFEGYSPEGLPRVFIGYRAICKSNVKMTMKRADKVSIPVQFSLLADSTKTVGERLALLMDITQVHGS